MTGLVCPFSCHCLDGPSAHILRHHGVIGHQDCVGEGAGCRILYTMINHDTIHYLNNELAGATGYGCCLPKQSI
jgi:hypothetical protein